jgi:glycosyltransferase involved in cell wall biosynthesis
MARADLSIIITCYNKPVKQLMECMQSIKEQTIEPKEVFLIDDCSKDPHAHAGAISVMLPKNVGVVKARDFGVKMSTGKLILFVDADDKLAPDFIQQCGKQIAKGADIAYPNMILFDGVPINKLVTNPGKITAKYVLGRKTSIPVTSMMWRKVYDNLGGFRDLPIFEDWDFWIRAMCKGYTFKRANTLLWYRQNPESRNHGDQVLKSKVHYQITAPYEIKDGRVVERKLHGRQKV